MTDTADSTLKVHYADELKAAQKGMGYRRHDVDTLLKWLEELNKIFGNSTGWNDISHVIEEVTRLKNADRRERHEGYEQTYLDAVENVGERVGKLISSLISYPAMIMNLAGKLDAVDARLNGIDDQRLDISPMEMMRIELEETKIDAMRGVSKEQAEAARLEAARIKAKTMCAATGVGGYRGICDKKAKVIIDGQKYCGIHAQPDIRDAKSLIEGLSSTWGRYGRNQHDPKKAKENELEIEIVKVQMMEPIQSAIKEAGKTGSVIRVERPSKEAATKIATERLAKRKKER